MGAPKVKTVGGGKARGVANEWNDWLGGMLKGNPMSQNMPGGGNGPTPPFGSETAFQQNAGNTPGVSNVGGGSGSSFANGVNSLLNPNIQTMIDNNPFLKNLSNFNPRAELPNAPTWNPTSFQQPGQINAGQVNYQNAAAGQSDVNGFMSQFGGGAGTLAQYGIDPTQFLTDSGVAGIPGLDQASGDFGYTGEGLVDPTGDPAFQAIRDIANRENTQNLANIRERFGSLGAGMSTGASLAEGQYLAEANPRMIASMSQLGRDIRGQHMQNRQINNALRLGLLGNQVQDRLGRFGTQAQLNIAGGAQRGQNFGNLLGFAQGIQGQNINAAADLTGRNAQNQTQVNIANADGGLRASGMNAQNDLTAAIENANNVMRMNSLTSQDNQAMNNFNQNNFAQNSQNALNNQQMANQFQQFLGSQGINLQQLAQSGQLGMISNLFGAFQQANGLGTPQAQLVQQPSGWSQALNAAAGIGTTIGGAVTGNPGLIMGGLGMLGGQGGAGFNFMGGGRNSPPAGSGAPNFNFPGLPTPRGSGGFDSLVGNGLGIGAGRAAGMPGLSMGGGGGMPMSAGLSQQLQQMFSGDPSRAGGPPGGGRFGGPSPQVFNTPMTGPIGGIPRSSYLNNLLAGIGG